MGVHLNAKSFSHDKVSQITRLKAHEELGLIFPLAQKRGGNRGNFSTIRINDLPIAARANVHKVCGLCDFYNLW